MGRLKSTPVYLGPERTQDDQASGEFYAGYRNLAIYGKLIGTNFLEHLGQTDWRKLECKQFGAYVWATGIAWFIEVGLGCVAFSWFWNLTSDLNRVERFHAYAYVAYVACVCVEATLNIETALRRRARLLKLIQTCSRLEPLLNTPPGTRRTLVSYSWGCIAFQVSLNAFCLSLAVISECGLINFRNATDVPTTLRVFTYMDGAIYMFAILPTCLLPRTCMTYFFRAFRLYLKYIRRNIENCMRSTLIPHDRKMEMLEEFRVMLSMLKTCVHEAGVTLGTGLLYTYGYAACLFCASIFYLFVPNTSKDVRIFFLGSGVMHFISLLVPTVAVHKFAEDVANLRNTIQSYYFATLPKNVLDQISMMTSSLEKENFRFSVNGFFSVHLPAYASIIGAALTYTIVLVQTHNLHLEDPMTFL